MDATTPTLTGRDRAVLRAVAAGRCVYSGTCGATLVVDGLCLCDQFTGARLTEAGLISAVRTGPAATLTPSGFAALAAA